MSEPTASYFELEPEEQANLLQQASKDLAVAPAILEKDIWLCLVLEKLFQSADRKSMVFKGGTSLSKVYRAIERFSEDIDITIDWTGLHPTPLAEDVLRNLSKTKIKALGEEIKSHLEAHIAQTLIPNLTETLLAVAPGITVGYEKTDAGDQVRDKLRISYPAVTEGDDDYLKSSILLEFGARNAIEPGETHEITPEVAASFQAISFPKALINVLSPKRTFWEKATLIHDECHRPADKAKANAKRMSRHWYDMAKLAAHEIGRHSLNDVAILNDVLEVKTRFFSYGFSRYDLCNSGGMKLIPEGPLFDALRDDYQAMINTKMFYGETLAFDEIVERLSHLQDEINQNFGRQAPDQQAGP